MKVSLSPPGSRPRRHDQAGRVLLLHAAEARLRRLAVGPSPRAAGVNRRLLPSHLCPVAPEEDDAERDPEEPPGGQRDDDGDGLVVIPDFSSLSSPPSGGSVTLSGGDATLTDDTEVTDA